MEKKKFDDGVHIISNDEYHSSHGVSRSALWTFKKSPYHYWWEYLRQPYESNSPTPSMCIGEYFHVDLLEPHLFSEKIAIEPDVNKRTNAGKKVLEEFMEANQGKTIVTLAQAEFANQMTFNLKRKELFLNLIEGAKIEHSIYFTHEPTGLQCKVRPDAWLGSIVTDLKTTADASYTAFQRSAYKFGYFLQAGMIYRAMESIGTPLEKFVNVCVENSEPFADAIYILDDDAIDYGVRLFDHLMAQFAECHEQDRWPAYPLQTLTIPAYHKEDF